MSRHSIRRLAGALVLPVLQACAAPYAVPPVDVQSSQPDLHRAAQVVLPDATSDATPLHLHEAITESIESFAGDGTVNAYIVHYSLTFRLHNEEERQIVLDHVVSVAEAHYLAGRRARTAAAIRLREEALRQMQYILSQQQ